MKTAVNKDKGRDLGSGDTRRNPWPAWAAWAYSLQLLTLATCSQAAQAADSPHSDPSSQLWPLLLWAFGE